MSVVQYIHNPYHFWEWLKKSNSYKTKFSMEGAKAIFDYYDNLSFDMNEPIEFDPVAWCCEFSEFSTALEAYNQHHGEDSEGEGTAIGDDNTAENAEAQALEWLNDNTTVIELDNGHVIIGEF